MDEIKNYILINALGGGGAERQVSLIATSNKVEKVVCLSGLIQYDINQDKLHLLNNSNGLSAINKIKAGLAAISYFKKKSKKEKIQITAFLTYSYILGFVIKRLTGCKLNIAIRTNLNAYYAHKKGSKIPKWLYRKILNTADTVICNAELTSIQVRQFVPKATVKTIYNGYDISKIETLAKSEISKVEEIAKHKKILVNIGRHIPSKAQHHLIKSFNALKYKTETVLFLLGTGPSTDSLKAICTKLNLNYFEEGKEPNEDYNVYFWGFQNNPYQFLHHAHALVFPSYYEGLPNVPIEAIICGVPVILSDCQSGPREILAPESNLETTASSIEHFVHGLLLPPFKNEHSLTDSLVLNKEEENWTEAMNDILSAKTKMNVVQLKEFQQAFSQESCLANWERQFSLT